MPDEPQPHRSIPRNVRSEVFERSGGKCALCGISNVQLDLAHILARSAGGTDDASNLFLLCANCNRAFSRSGASELEFISYVAALLSGHPADTDVRIEPALTTDSRMRPDLTVVHDLKGQKQNLLIECKNTPFLDQRRLDAAIVQVARYRRASSFDSYVLAFPGRLSQTAQVIAREAHIVV